MTPSRGVCRVELAARMWTLRRVGGLEATSSVLRVWVGVSRLEAAAVLVCVSEKTQSGSLYAAEPPQAAWPNRLTDAIGFCSAKAGSSQEPLGAEARTGAASLALYSTRLRYLFFWRLLDVFTKRLHSYERRLPAIGRELRRIRAPVCLRAWWRRLRPW